MTVGIRIVETTGEVYRNNELVFQLEQPLRRITETLYCAEADGTVYDFTKLFKDAEGEVCSDLETAEELNEELLAWTPFKVPVLRRRSEQKAEEEIRVPLFDDLRLNYIERCLVSNVYARMLFTIDKVHAFDSCSEDLIGSLNAQEDINNDLEVGILKGLYIKDLHSLLFSRPLLPTLSHAGTLFGYLLNSSNNEVMDTFTLFEYLNVNHTETTCVLLLGLSLNPFYDRLETLCSITRMSNSQVLKMHSVLSLALFKFKSNDHVFVDKIFPLTIPNATNMNQTDGHGSSDASPDIMGFEESEAWDMHSFLCFLSIGLVLFKNPNEEHLSSALRNTSHHKMISIALMYLNSNNRHVASLLTPSQSTDNLHPDYYVCYLVCKYLILYDEVIPTKDFLYQKDSLEISYAIVATAYLLGLKFAGYHSREIVELLKEIVLQCVDVVSSNAVKTSKIAKYKWLEKQAVCRRVLVSCLRSLGMVMSGSCDLETIRIIRFVKLKVGPSSEDIMSLVQESFALVCLGRGTSCISTQDDTSLMFAIVSTLPELLGFQSPYLKYFMKKCVKSRLVRVVTAGECTQRFCLPVDKDEVEIDGKMFIVPPFDVIVENDLKQASMCWKNEMASKIKKKILERRKAGQNIFH